MTEVSHPDARKRSGNRIIKKAVDVVGRLVVGDFTVILPDGSAYKLSSNTGRGPHAVVQIVRWRCIRKFLTQGDYGFVESYLDGDWESPEISNLSLIHI